ncbi:MAG TPA: tetratricopeptide repeat protein, partial [Candidatus Limnocylindria bacterium]|nr:tetratricopeptide repeat protein [Candidatus Limnocylindria bacterium]
FRSRLAELRMVIVLDNAATEAQVKPLLPGAPGCVVLVTSRRRLAGLDHTHTLSVDTLPLPDANTLLSQTAGEDRLAGQPLELVAEVVELCGRLPLAIRIAAARLRSHPSWDLAHLVARLRDQQTRLAELEAGQRSVTAALDLSYQDLVADERRTYRLLGLHPGADIEAYSAAALLDTTVPAAVRLLEHLLEAHLLLEPTPGRYRFHDLTRAHAAHTAARDEIDHSGREALDRLLDHYRHTAAMAMDTAYPFERGQRPQIPPAHTPGPALPDPGTASDWLDTELPNLLAATRYAADHDRPAHLLQLSTVLNRHLRTRGHYHDAEALYQQALATARATGNQAAEAEALVSLGHLHRTQGHLDRATDQYQPALLLARTTGHQAAEVEALNCLGNIHRLQGRHVQATDHHQQALGLAVAMGHRAVEFDALIGLGDIHRMQGRLDRATDQYHMALLLARTIDHRTGELTALVCLGSIHTLRGMFEQANDHYQQGLRLARAIGHPIGELNSLAGLGLLHRMFGRHDRAADHLGQAVLLARATGHRAAEQAALNGLSDIHRIQGRYEQAADEYRQLLDLATEAGSRNFQFEARQGLGRLHHATGDPDAALTEHTEALALATELDQPRDQARAHNGLAYAHDALHQPDQAREHWQLALDILTRLGTDQTDDGETTVAAIRANLALTPADPR